MYDTPEGARDAGDQLSEELGGASLAEMRAMPVDKIVRAASKLKVGWRPAIDNHVLPRSPTQIYADGEQNDVPILLGSNKDEASLELATRPDSDPAAYKREVEKKYGDLAGEFLSLYPGDSSEQVLESRLQAKTDQSFARAMFAWSRAAVATGDSNTYLYYFTRTSPEDGLEKYGAYHGSELMYAYDNLGADGNADYTSTDHRLRDEMAGYWMNFIATGDPNDTGLPPWESTRSAPGRLMELGDTTGMIGRPHAAAVDFWMRYTGPTG